MHSPACSDRPDPPCSALDSLATTVRADTHHHLHRQFVPVCAVSFRPNMCLHRLHEVTAYSEKCPSLPLFPLSAISPGPFDSRTSLRMALNDPTLVHCIDRPFRSGVPTLNSTLTHPFMSHHLVHPSMWVATSHVDLGTVSTSGTLVLLTTILEQQREISTSKYIIRASLDSSRPLVNTPTLVCSPRCPLPHSFFLPLLLRFFGLT